MIRIEKEKTGNLIKTFVSDKLTQEDYDQLIPVLEETLENWKNVRWYFEMQDFKGWSMGGAFMDMSLGVRHTTDLSKLAMVGEKRWQESLSHLMKPFTTAEVRFYPLEEREKALEWITS
ncbi:SpoIIAA family protein [Cesiribacter andamanensis]|uniref:STAS/SEC14 domain-containing protein n=1 Tax=Cesiribacter andamanensis AMV16 TaxID=1279009 RepID=M7N2T0_9BACT|nr:STAS/SEC14 domain-containing protein [Cesiribacter andamanensis]EMR01526.1 hypothetical protein ADICEAN_03341 [Cesiribacter andamanensis AMV16]